MFQTDKHETARFERVAESPPRILLVLPDLHLRGVLALACEQAGMHVHDCPTVALARKACRRRNVDLIVVDWMVEGFFADDLLMILESVLLPQPLPTSLVLSRMGDEDTRDCLRPDSPILGILTRPKNSAEFLDWAPAIAAALKRTHERLSA